MCFNFTLPHVCCPPLSSIGRVGLFLREHDTSLREHLGAPVRSVGVPSHLSLLDSVFQHPDGSYTATAKDMTVFRAALSVIEISTGSQFSSHRSHQNPAPKHLSESATSTRVRTDYQCRFAGKPHSECTRRGELPIEFRMKSAKSVKCSCTASISVTEPSAAGQPLTVRLDLTHTGHVLGSDSDKTSLPMHPRFVLLDLVFDRLWGHLA